MAKIIKNNLGNFLVICLIFLTMTIWIFSGKPQVWKKPAFPPEIQEARAGDQTITETGVWDAPLGVTTVTVEVRGGGAGGGQGQVAPKAERSGGAGGGGAFTRCTSTVIPEQTYNVTVGVAVGTDTNGNPSDFTGGNGTCTANGGTTGANTAGGAGGTAQAVGGIVTAGYAGGAGGNGSNTAGSGGGGGGEGAGSGGTGGAGGNGESGGSGAGGTGGTGTDGGDGGVGGTYVGGGTAGTIPGGGGGGASSDNNTGGNGERGQVYLSWEVAATYSVTITTAPVTYGIVALGATNDTIAEGETQIAENNGTTAAKFNIKGSNSADWTITTGVPSSEDYRHRFATESGTWTALDLNYQTLVASIAQNATQGFDLEVLISTGTAIEAEQNVNVWVQAVQP